MATKLLTRTQWMKKTAPFMFIKVENDSWGQIEKDMIQKWIEAYLGAGWVYWDGDKTYAFGSDGDCLAFKMWITTAFDKPEGTIKQ